MMSATARRPISADQAAGLPSASATTASTIQPATPWSNGNRPMRQRSPRPRRACEENRIEMSCKRPRGEPGRGNKHLDDEEEAERAVQLPRVVTEGPDAKRDAGAGDHDRVTGMQLRDEKEPKKPRHNRTSATYPLQAAAPRDACRRPGSGAQAP